MKIKTIKFCNFRQFNGEHSIEFSQQTDKNITVIHGENGGGKTAILNAFKWALYEETDLDTGDTRLLNKQALAEAEENEELILFVQVEFEHDGLNYTAKRTQKFIKSEENEKKSGAAVLQLEWTDPHGGFDRAPNAEVRIKQILPKNLHTYFFFHGERIEKLASIDGTEKVREAIKNLMGIEVVERALNHLDGKVKKHFKSEQKKYASPKDAQLLQQIEELDNKIKTCDIEIANHNKSITEARIDIEDINKKIEANKETEALQNQRKKIEDDIKFTKDQLDALSADNRRLINTKGFLAFFKDPAKEVSSVLEEKRKKGELPYKVKRQFIEDLLSEGKCICGSDLSEGTSGHDHVQKFKQRAGAADLEEGYMNTTGALSNVQPDSEELFKQLKDNLKHAGELKGKKDKLIEELDAISDKLGSSENEEISGLEARRKVLTAQIQKCEQEIGGNNTLILQYREEKSNLEKEYKEEAEKSGRANQANKKYEIACACKDALQRIIDSFSNEIREKLSDRVKETVDNILRNEYQAKIDNNYSLKFYQNTPSGFIEVPDLSSGQRVVASLSFIASIINVAKKKYQSEGSSEYFPGGLYPLVMDTPFGNADDDHSKNIARYIPELADQVIILVSNKNWSTDVDQICRSKIGKEYSLVHYSPNPKEGVDQQYERKSQTGYEHSKIEEGHYGR